MTMLVKGSQRAQLWLSKECQKRVVWDDRARKGSHNSPALAPSGVSEEGNIRDDDARTPRLNGCWISLGVNVWGVENRYTHAM